MTSFALLLLAVSFVAGAVASIVGFGIGSLLTPLLATQVGLKLAVAAVSIPHVIGTGVRFWQMRVHIDRRVLWTFGIASAAGGLVGAVVHTFLRSAILTAVFALLLMFAGGAGLTGLAGRMRFRGWAAWLAGGLSGVFGGLVGNQGGIRSAALLGFNVSRDAFVGTATAVALMVDAARMPVYIVTQGGEILREWPRVLLMTAGVLSGTLAGRHLLKIIPEQAFRRIVSTLILLLGFYMAYRAWEQWTGG